MWCIFNESRIEEQTGVDPVAFMGGEENREGPFYNPETLDDGRVVAPG